MDQIPFWFPVGDEMQNPGQTKADKRFGVLPMCIKADNVQPHKKRSVVKMCHDEKGKVFYVPPASTPCLQPIDCGHLGAFREKFAKENGEVLMEKDDEEDDAAAEDPNPKP